MEYIVYIVQRYICPLSVFNTSHITPNIIFTPKYEFASLPLFFLSHNHLYYKKTMVQTTPSPLTFVQKFASRWITSEESSNPTKALDGRIYAIMVPPNYPSRNKGLIWFNLRPKA